MSSRKLPINFDGFESTKNTDNRKNNQFTCSTIRFMFAFNFVSIFFHIPHWLCQISVFQCFQYPKQFIQPRRHSSTRRLPRSARGDSTCSSRCSRLTHIKVKAVRRDGASALALSIISSKARILNRMEMSVLGTVSLTELNHETDGTKSCNMITKTNNTQCRHASLYVCVCVRVCVCVCVRPPQCLNE
jgi:hypothetical protein